MRDREGEQGRWPGYVNFTKVIFRSHQTEVCFPRGPPVLGMTSYELIGACRYGSVMAADEYSVWLPRAPADFADLSGNRLPFLCHLKIT